MKLEDEILQSKFNNEFHKLAVNILFTSNWLTQKHEAVFKQYEITTQQFNILRILRGQHPKPASVNLLRDRMIDKMSDVSRLIERLRLKGFVSRKESSEDRRMADVLITQNGLDLLQNFEKEVKMMEGFLSKLNEQEVKQLNDLLDRLRG